MKQKNLDIILLSFLATAVIIAAIIIQSKPKELVNCLRKSNKAELTKQQSDIIYNYSKKFPDGTEFSIAFIEGDSIKYIGIRRLNDSLYYTNNRSAVFEIGSITKTFTGTLLAKMVYDRILDVNEPVRNLLPIKMKQSSLNGKEITLLQLANHTSGLPRDMDKSGINRDLSYTQEKQNYVNELYDYLANRCTLKSTPGEKRSYSNLGATILGHILTLKLNKSYEELMKEAITDPLDMQNTFIQFTELNKTNLVNGRDAKGNVIGNDEVGIVGAGGIKSTAGDMVKYIIACIEDTSFIKLAEQGTFDEDEHNTACLGWGYYKYNGLLFYGAFGNTPGYSCGVIFEKTAKVGFVLLSNVSASQGEDITKMCRELFNSVRFAKE
jgi:CubicO group peptidase (beta-lactamase class C family)